MTYRDHGDGTIPEGDEPLETDAGGLVERDVRVTAASLPGSGGATHNHAGVPNVPAATAPPASR